MFTTATATPPTDTTMTSTERRHPTDAIGPVAVRATRQRRAVSDALAELDDFHSAQQIHDILSRRGDRVGLSTVYRTLQSLADAHEVDVLRSDDGEALYRRCSSGHHHHLVCRTCGRTVEVEGPTVERWADRIAAEHDFADVSHTLEIFGVCADCR
jgi:Fur family transcriptional regulator, ferric uptake regulator